MEHACSSSDQAAQPRQVPRWASTAASSSSDGLAVEPGRERLADRFASHAVGVARLGRLVPEPARLGGVDDLTALARAAAEGDRVATTAFVRRTQPEVWRVCARLGDRADADDLTQEVYLRALPALARFRGDASARTWLLQIARHVCADHVRRSTRRRALVGRLAQRSLRGGPGRGPAHRRARPRGRDPAPDPGSAGGLRAHAGGGAVLRGGGGGVRGARSARSAPGSPGPARDLLDAIADDATSWGSAGS